jgi:hypothetical protein
MASINPHISHPHVAQTTVGIEQQIAADATLEARYINRRFKDFIGNLDLGSLWVPVSRRDPGPDNIAGTADDGAFLTLYQLANPGNRSLLVTNPPDAYRQYDAVQVIGTKRYSRDWQLLAGYTWARVAGTVSTGQFTNAFLDRGDFAWAGPFTDPNRFVNKDARFSASELKVEATYHFPWFAGVNASAVFRRVSGAPVRRIAQFPGLTAVGFEPVIAESQISRFLDAQKTLDARVEKTLRVAKYTVGAYLDAFNLTNQGIATSVVMRSGTVFGTPLSWSDPRLLRAGARVTF